MLVIDRFEGDFAIIDDDGESITIKKEFLPEVAAEGDVLVIAENGYTVDEAQTKKRREQTLALLKRLGL